MRPLSLFLPAALACIIGSAAPPARADAASEASALIAKGISLREKGRDEEALEVFQRALNASPSARARAQVALAEQALGMWVAAEADLQAALAAGDDPWIGKNRAALEGALATIQKRLGSLEVRGGRKGEVFLDGVKVGDGGGPFRALAGQRTLEVRAAGFHPTTRAVEIPSGGVARETVSLVAVSAPETPSPEEAPEGATRAPEPQSAPVTGKGQRVAGWALVGLGGAALVTGGAALFVRSGLVADYNADCPGVGAAQSPACHDRVRSAGTWMTASIVSFVSGGVAALGGAALVLTAPSARAERSATARPRLGCAPTAGLGVACAGTF